MKKGIVILLIALLLFSTANASTKNEISFLDIPWLSDDTTVMQTLSDKGYIRAGETININTEKGYYLKADNEGIIEQIEDVQSKGYNRSITLQNAAKGRIAGYPVDDLVFSFAYNGEYQLIYVEAVLLGANYNDIKKKLETVYKTGDEGETTLGYKITSWKGKNNTCILLYTYDEGESYRLYYGRLDAEEILEKCQQPNPRDYSGL